MATRKSPRKTSASARPSRRIQRSSRTSTPAAVQTRKEASAVPTVALPVGKWTTLITVLAAAILAFGLFLVFRSPAGAPVATSQQQEISYQGVDGKNALELLKSNATVETQNYEGIGEMVTSINGMPSNADNYWLYYVNGEPGQVGADAYVTKSSDTITWRYEAAQQ